MGQVPPPTGACTEDEEDVVVAADAIATPAPDAGDPELAVQQRKGKRKKKKRRRRRKRPTEQEVAARRSVLRWACPGREAVGDHEAGDVGRRRPRVAVELHAHSAFSDGSLSPADLVERAHRNGVKVLALTDHDTMAGVPEAVEAAKQYPIRIIPGVEISAVHSPRDGRYARAKQMLQKLKDLGMPMKLEDVCKIAGNGVAPGRLHVARAMVDAGYVENLRQAFSRGSEPNGKSVVQLVCRTGGVAVLAHPWALKNPAAVVKDLKAAGLHGIEVYRSDGKVSGLSDLADTYNLLKLGGSDFHGRDDKEEPDVGSVDLPVLAVLNFLEVAKPIWHNAIREMFASISKRTTDLNGSKRLRRASSAGNFCILCLSSEDQGLTHAP
ncbi:hypothetical protein SORBI_3004G233500 [Sorghum bicolor]|uniref:Polymerase/histidinol phosphatase N-terminal domain-containing protein n=1 Tax=Sorghum bicolor TaxID=4558 RepID=A0A1Z5RPN7_SORBI|nr:hypothetical protein SORBI_3004G233500 [Sorghum bicolor]